MMDWLPRYLPRDHETPREPVPPLVSHGTGSNERPSKSPFDIIAEAIRPPRERNAAVPQREPENARADVPIPVLTASIAERTRERSREAQPHRKPRTAEPANVVGLQLRPEERRLLLEVGKYRVVKLADLSRHVYGGKDPQLRRDLGYLRKKDLVTLHALSARRDGRSVDIRKFEAITLTEAGKKLLEKSGTLPEGQRVYAGLVKPREAEHDSQIYTAALKEIEKLEKAGAQVRTIQLDFELKAKAHRAVYLARKTQPQSDPAQIRAEVAQQQQLPISNGQIVFPDARLEYETPSGGNAHLDIEVATAAYRHGHIAQKVQAGFKLYMGQGDIGRLGAAVQDDHDLMSEILDL